MIAGLEEISGGDLLIDGKRIMTFQPKHAISRWCSRTTRCTAYDGLRQHGVWPEDTKNRQEMIDERVNWAAQILGLREYLNASRARFPAGNVSEWRLGGHCARSGRVFNG